MPGVTLPSAGSSTKKVDIGPRRLRRAQRRFQRPGTGIRRCRDSNPGAGNPGVGSVPRPLMRDPAPRAGLLRIRAGGRRPVSARLGPPDPSDVAARLQRAGPSEPRDGCLLDRRGRPLAYSSNRSSGGEAWSAWIPFSQCRACDVPWLAACPGDGDPLRGPYRGPAGGVVEPPTCCAGEARHGNPRCAQAGACGRGSRVRAA